MTEFTGQKNLSINNIEYYLPQKVVTNDDLSAENPEWDMARALKNTGVYRRHIASDNETAFDLGLAACNKLLDGLEQMPTIDAIIFCTQSPDHIIPSNAFLLHKSLKLSQDCLAFDYNLACSGYVYGLAIAEGLLATKRAKNILLVTADTYSKYIYEQDRSARLLFGDGASASLLTSGSDDLCVCDILCGTSGQYYDKFIIPVGGLRQPKTQDTDKVLMDPWGNPKSACHINMDGMGIMAFVNSEIPKHVKQLLKRNNLEVSDISLFVFHQASRSVLDALARFIGIKAERMYINIENIGNTVSSSIPIALKEAMEQKRISKGNKIVICGFGAGLSWASALIEV